MQHINVTIKRVGLYVIGLFFLSLGVGFSIQADLGVSPVASLPYAIALTTGLSVGAMTIVANGLFIVLQVVLSKRFNLRETIVQLIIAFLFGFCMDFALFLLQFVPAPETMALRLSFLTISLFVVAIGLIGYTSVKFPLMPYDELTAVIAQKFKWPFGKAKITSDLLNVFVAGMVCIIFFGSLGAVGIGTVAAAYLIGKILGWMIRYFREPLLDWVYRNHEELYRDTIVLQAEKEALEGEPAQRDSLQKKVTSSEDVHSIL
jgi:uncharacterized protein